MTFIVSTMSTKRHTLGDLQDETIRLEPASPEFCFDHGHKAGIVELSRREIDRHVRGVGLSITCSPGAGGGHGLASANEPSSE